MKTKNKLISTPLASLTMLACIASPSVVMATTNPATTVATQTGRYQASQEHIDFNGTLVQSPYGIAANDPSTGQNTTYMPIWYVMQVLKTNVGVQSTWDGTNWHLTLPSGVSSSVPLKAATASKSPNHKNIYVNSTLIASVPSLDGNDPQSGTATTYVPVWYIMQILHDIRVQSAWDGLNWQLSNNGSIDSSSSSSASSVSSAAPTRGTIQIVVNGKAIVSSAQTITQDNTTYVSLYDAEQLVKNITGDQVGTMQLNSNGQYNQAQQWNGSSKVWDIAWSHAIANEVPGTQGNATFELNGAPILHTNVIVQNGSSFAPISAFQQVIDQMIGTNSSTDTLSGSQWEISYNANQSYTTSNVGTGQAITGTGGTPTDQGVTGFGWGN